MAIDRQEALRKAEKLLRQGRLDEAIAEYERVVSAVPDDMVKATSLGDLVEFEAWEEGSIDLPEAVDRLTAEAAASTTDGVDPATAAASASSTDGDELPAVGPEPLNAAPSSTLDHLFASMRGRAALDPTLPPGDHAARNFRVGPTYAAADMVREASDAFEQSARDPRYRFRSAQALARLYRKQGMIKEAVDWLDIASEAPAPKVDEHRAALYELADALEASGETTRALVVLLDLVAEQDDYRDARARIERLSRVQA